LPLRFISNCWGVPKGAKAFQCLKDHMAKLSSGCQQAAKAAIPAPPPAPATTETSPPAQEAKTAPATAPNSTPATPPKAPSEPPAKHAKAEAPAEPARAPAAAPAEMPPIIGFIPPRMKLMVLMNCHHDLETYCADVPFGEGRNLRCLFGHKAALTPDCQGDLSR
jgi:hypothetical protein